jgi:hypothetical protein
MRMTPENPPFRILNQLFLIIQNYVVQAHPSDGFDSFDPEICEEEDRNEDLFETTEKNKSGRIC